MAVSSKSIIHYTENLETLKSIISDGSLRLKYCQEDLALYEENHLPAAYPMVCFCDLPLTLAKDHIKKYGSYGIGFSKSWAQEYRLNPVFYLENNSTISKYLTEQAVKYLTFLSKAEKDKLSDSEKAEYNKNKQDFARLMAFCKNHQGPLVRGGKTVHKSYVFYDEREWRYVPDLALLKNIKLGLSANDYKSKKEHYNSLLSEYNLPFEHSSISYIIVKNESDIDVIARSLTAKYRDDLNPPVMRKLLTKIISVQQIEDDF